MSDCPDKKVVESIQLQIEFTIKTAAVIRLRASRVARITANWRSCRRGWRRQTYRMQTHYRIRSYRTFQETESLEHTARRREPTMKPIEVAGNKMPKDDKVIIEELQTANITCVVW